MRSSRFVTRAAVVVVAGATLLVTGVSSVLAHEPREVGPFEIEVGFLDEPVYVGKPSGLELQVSRNGEPVANVDDTLQAEVRYGASVMPLELLPAEGTEEGYRGEFVPTAAGPYTFHLTGSIDGTPIDESFTSGPSTFAEVQEAPGGQFPLVLPTVSELAATARASSDASAMLAPAVAIGVAALIVAVLALGVAISARRKAEVELPAPAVPTSPAPAPAAARPARSRR